MEYRFATEQDIELLMDIRLEMLRVVNDLPEDYQFSQEFVENTRAYYGDGNQTTVLALNGDRVVGVAGLSYIDMLPTFDHPTGHRAHLMNVYTNVAYRRQGISRKLVGMLIEEARDRGITEISLDATTMGRPLYESVGFVASEECMTLVLS